METVTVGIASSAFVNTLERILPQRGYRAVRSFDLQLDGISAGEATECAAPRRAAPGRAFEHADSDRAKPAHVPAHVAPGPAGSANEGRDSGACACGCGCDFTVLQVFRESSVNGWIDGSGWAGAISVRGQGSRSTVSLTAPDSDGDLVAQFASMIVEVMSATGVQPQP